MFSPLKNVWPQNAEQEDAERVPSALSGAGVGEQHRWGEAGPFHGAEQDRTDSWRSLGLKGGEQEVTEQVMVDIQVNRS